MRHSSSLATASMTEGLQWEDHLLSEQGETLRQAPAETTLTSKAPGDLQFWLILWHQWEPEWKEASSRHRNRTRFP